MIEGWEKKGLTAQLELIIRPREDWLDIHAITGILPEILDAIVAISDHPIDRGQVTEFCRQVHADKHDPSDLIKGIAAVRGLRGLKGEFPQHAGLRELAKRPSIHPWLARCAALIVKTAAQWDANIARAEEKIHGDLQQELHSDLVNAWRAVRLLRPEALDRMPTVRNTPQAMERMLKRVRFASDTRDLDSEDFVYIGYLDAFFSHFLGKGNFRSKNSAPSDPVSLDLPVENILVSESTDADSDIDVVEDPLFSTNRATADVRKTEGYIHGNASDEYRRVGPVLRDCRETVRVNAGDSPYQSIQRSRSREDHIRRSAQYLPGRWDELNEDELSRVFQFIDENRFVSPALTSLILLMLITGRPAEVVLQARLVKSSEQLPKNPKPTGIYLVYDLRAWVTGTLHPPERRQRVLSWPAVLQRHRNDIQLPLPVGIWECFIPQMQPLIGRCKQKSVGLFKIRDHGELGVQLTRTLKHLSRVRKARLTEHRIEHQLFSALVQSSTDVVDASLITGKLPPFGQSAALYYHSCDREHLADVYAAAIGSWEKLLDRPVNTQFGPQRDLIDGTVGSNLTLEPYAVKMLVQDLRKQLDADRQRLGVSGGLQRFHNALTNYSLILLFFATGYRAVVDPIAQETDFCVTAGFLVVTDKTGDSMGHSRMIPLCQILQQQLEYYSAHVKWLSDHLRWSGVPSEHAPFFIYLAPDLSIRRIRPSVMSDELSWAYGLPLNLSRHLLRGELRANGISGPQVNRFMGHWGIGQEPWGRYSGADPAAFHDQITKVLDRLIPQWGFQPERGAPA